MLKKYTFLLILIVFKSHISQAEEFNSKDTKRHLQQCNTENNANACYSVGESFFTGQGNNQNYYKAYDAFKKACDGGYIKGCSKLSSMHINALGNNKGISKSLTLSKKACDNGGLLGCFNLGLIYQYPRQYGQIRGLRKDLTKAFKLYKTACDGGVYTACSYLGRMLERGHGVQRNYSKAVQLYLKSCDFQDLSGCREVLRMHKSGNYKIKYDDGTPLKPDYSKIISAHKISCNNGNLNKCADLAWMQKLFNQDEKKEIKVYKQTCKAGGLRSCYQLGLKYELGSGVKKNKKKFLKLHQKACDGGYHKACSSIKKYKTTTSKTNLGHLKEKCNNGLADSCNKLGLAYNDLQNKVEAIKYYKKACDIGSKSGCINYKFSTKSPETKELESLQRKLVFSEGKEQKDNFKKIKQFAIKGNPDAAYTMFEAYQYGLGVKRSNEKMDYWLNKSVELGSSQGMTTLGYNLIFEKNNPKEGIQWLMQSAEQGDDFAQYLLGNAYLNGQGVEKSKDKALFWLEKSAAQGRSHAKSLLKKLDEN